MKRHFLVSILIIVLSILIPTLATADITDITGYTGQIGSEDINWGTGETTDTFTVPTYDGSTTTITKVPSPYANQYSKIKNIWYVNNSSTITDHGAATGADYVAGNLKKIIDLAGSDPTAIELPGNTNYPLLTNLTIPDNVVIRHQNGAIFTGTANLVFSGTGSIDAGSYQIYNTSGTVSFQHGQKCKSAWWPNLSTAVTQISTAKVYLNITKALSLTGAITIPSTLTVEGSPGAPITLDGYNFIINGPFKAGNYHMFQYTGGATGIIFGPGSVADINPMWLGLSTTESAANNSAYIEESVNIADSSSCKSVYIPTGAYTVGQVDLDSINKVSIRGAGSSTQLTGTGSVLFDLNQFNRGSIKDMHLYTETNNTTLLNVYYSLYNYFENIWIQGNSGTGTGQIGISVGSPAGNGTYVNTFVACRVTTVGGQAVYFHDRANANRFLGCCFSADSAHTTTVLIDHQTDGKNNTFSDCDIENAGKLVNITDGFLTITNSFFEASNESSTTSGGLIKLTENYFNPTTWEISAGGIILKNNNINDPAAIVLNSGNPFLTPTSDGTGITAFIVEDNYLAYSGTACILRGSTAQVQYYSGGWANMDQSLPTAFKVSQHGVWDVNSSAQIYADIRYQDNFNFANANVSIPDGLLTLNGVKGAGYKNATFADDATYNLSDAVDGMVFVSADAESGVWVVQNDGSVVKVTGTANTAATDSDTDLCVYDGGTYAIVKNRLGGAAELTVMYLYH